MSGITLVNFSHPMTDAQLDAIAARLGEPVTRVIDVPTHFDPARPFGDQAAELLDRVDVAWETTPVLINLPSFAPISAVVLARLHGLMGHFPAIVRLQPVSNAGVTIFAFTEIISLDGVRLNSRRERKAIADGEPLGDPKHAGTH